MNIDPARVHTLEVWTTTNHRIRVEQSAWNTRVESFDRKGDLVDVADSISIDFHAVVVGEPLRWLDYATRRPHTTAPVVQVRVTFR